jgi:hypothetical protein
MPLDPADWKRALVEFKDLRAEPPVERAWSDPIGG